MVNKGSRRSLAKEAPYLNPKTSDKKLPMNPTSNDSCDNLLYITPFELEIDNEQLSINSRVLNNTL
jgi:hypothetical protein